MIAEVPTEQTLADTGRVTQAQVVEKITESRKENGWPALKEWMGLLIKAGLWALIIYQFVFQVFVVNGSSMTPTFLPGDKLVVDKLTYRLAPISRHDVVVFGAVDFEHWPRRSIDYIKRVIGLPGEKVEIRKREIWIDGRKIKDRFGIAYTDLVRDTFTVPDGHYLVMGDNRQTSRDSLVRDRGSTLGYVSVRQVKGVVRARYWPRDRLAWFGRGTEEGEQEQQPGDWQ